MKDPKRLLDDLGSSSDAASLLRGLRPAQPPSLEKQAELVQRLMTPMATPLPLTGIAVGTWAAGAAVVAGAFAVIWLLWPAAAIRAVKPPPAPAALGSTIPNPSPEVVPAPAASARVFPVEALPSVASSRTFAARDSLAEEEALLEQARRALTTSPRAAISLLHQHQQRFPTGQLTAERLFLSIDALRREGDRAGAERQTQALLKRFPSSVYAGQLRNQAAP